MNWHMFPFLSFGLLLFQVWERFWGKGRRKSVRKEDQWAQGWKSGEHKYKEGPVTAAPYFPVGSP